MMQDPENIPAHTTVVHRKEKHDIFIGRPSKWGNPYKIGRDGTRDEVIAKYESYILQNKKLIDAIPELRGKILGCFCHPLSCHGDVLARMANEL